MSKIEQMRQFYLGTTAHSESLFDTWERGAARGDSVTPSTFSPEYRQWIGDLLLEHLRAKPGGMISIGSGNATVEAELVRAGHRVLAVDVIPEAVELARSKGVEAVLADVHHWSPPAGDWTVVYADGVMGHLYDPQAGLQPVLTQLRSWLGIHRGSLVISNDRPSGLADVQPAPGVPGFYWLSEDFLRKEADTAGFDELTSTTFRYERPLSGTRERAILTARA
jgi:SAM-dependent methyltransferase